MEGAQGSKLCKPSSHDKKTEVIINLTLTRILPPPPCLSYNPTDQDPKEARMYMVKPNSSSTSTEAMYILPLP